ncbi:glyoxalase family protein [Pelagivirga sediminicola]|uniref:Glyoxalase family protein n=1 Tax=Pelagivirga sediminicola TaxID=2170575 RepID=A0A2T7GAF9_9RHOB|nr:glyoxalase family protein [Pelagivirga sediminicola]
MVMDYVEFYAPELEREQAFMGTAFGWEFVDYGPDYRDIRQAGIGGGIERAAQAAPLIVLKADDLEAALAQVRAAGATITRDIFDFPGGRRFEFRTPAGTQMAVWCKAAE